MNITQDFIPFGALLKRELVVHLRRRSSGSGLIVLVGLAIGGVWLMTATPFPRGLASMVFTSGIYLGYLVSFLLVPTVAAASIASERQNQTIDLLQLTLLRASGVVIAKMLNAVGYFLLLCVGVLPVFGVIFFYVGVDVAQFLQGVSIILSATLAHAAIGVAASASQRSPMRAIVRAFALTVFWSSGLFIGVLMLSAGIIAAYLGATSPGSSPTGSIAFFSLVSCVPWYALSGMLTMRMMPPGMGLSFLPITTVGYQLVVCALALAYATFAFRRASRKNPPADVAPLSFGNRSGKGATRWISDRANPVFVKEHRNGFLAMRNVRWLPRMRLPYIVFTAACLITMLAFVRGAPLLMPITTFMYMAAIGLAVLTPAITASGIVRERSTATFELLATSLLTPRQIIFGHMHASLRGVLTLFCAVILGISLGGLCFGVFPRESLLTILQVALVCLLQFPVLAALGAVAGALSTAVSRAITMAYLLAIIYLIFPFVLMLAIPLLLGESPFSGPLPPYLERWVEPVLRVLSSPLMDFDSSARRLGNAFWLNLAYHAVIWIPFALLAARIFGNLQRAESAFQRILNNSILPKEF